MNENQAETIIELLSEISGTLTKISNKISKNHESDTIVGKLNDVVLQLTQIETNTTIL